MNGHENGTTMWPRWIAVVLGCLVLVSPSTAAEFVGSHGISLQYPDGWVALSDNEREAASRMTEFSHPEFAAIIQNATSDEFTEEISVVVAKDVQGASLHRLSMMRVLAGGSGAKISKNIDTRPVKMAYPGAGSWRYDVTRAGFPDTIRQWQVFFSRGGKEYIITCSALASEFDKYEPAFSAAISSFRVDIGFEGFVLELPKWFRRGIGIAILSGIVGAIIAAARWLFRERCPPTGQTPPTVDSPE